MVLVGRDMDDTRSFFTHPAVKAGISTGIGYGILLVFLTILLFLLPYGLFRVL